jgi:hypothetical protein
MELLLAFLLPAGCSDGATPCFPFGIVMELVQELKEALD